jgi:hypothetical protein
VDGRGRAGPSPTVARVPDRSVPTPPNAVTAAPSAPALQRAQGPGAPVRHRSPASPRARHWDAGAIVAGVDEVGRGAWAGPVTYAAVVLPSDRRIYKLRDSKVLSPESASTSPPGSRTSRSASGSDTPATRRSTGSA